MSTTDNLPLSIVYEDDGDVTLILTSDQVLLHRQQLEEDRYEKKALSCPRSVSEPPLIDLTTSPVKELVPGNDVHIKLASAVLVRISPVFKLWLRDNSEHGKLLKKNGSVQFYDEDVSPECVYYILNFFHFRYADVPGFNPTVPFSFEQYVEALVIIDKWDLHQATQLLKDQWWNNRFSRQVPRSVEEYLTRQPDGQPCDLRSWISVTFILGKQKELDELLKIYKLCSTGFHDADFDLPLPEKLRMAERQRLKAFASLNQLLSDYDNSATQFSTKTLCQCNSLPVARECDRQTFEHLSSAFKRNRWVLSASRSRADRGRHVAQLDPYKVTFHVLRCRIPRITRYPHHCQDAAVEAAKAAEAARALATARAAEQKRLRQLYQLAATRPSTLMSPDPYMGGELDSSSVIDFFGLDFGSSMPWPNYSDDFSYLKQPPQRNSTAQQSGLHNAGISTAIAQTMPMTSTTPVSVSLTNNIPVHPQPAQPTFSSVSPATQYPWPIQTSSFGSNPTPSGAPPLITWDHAGTVPDQVRRQQDARYQQRGRSADVQARLAVRRQQLQHTRAQQLSVQRLHQQRHQRLRQQAQQQQQMRQQAVQQVQQRLQHEFVNTSTHPMHTANVNAMDLNTILDSNNLTLSPTDLNSGFDFSNPGTGQVDTVDLYNEDDEIPGASSREAGNGHSASDPITVESYQARSQQEEVYPCNPGPYQYVMDRLLHIEAELLKPVPEFNIDME